MITRNDRTPLALGAAAVVLAASGFWALQQAGDLRDDPAVRNVALTDTAGTSEVKGAVSDMFGKVFSYNYTDPAKTQKAQRDFLTGAAVGQYEKLFADVRTQAPQHKTVLTTTVTQSAVTTLRDGRARLLLFADQRTTRTTDGRTSTAAAMLAVDAARSGGTWKITGLSTFPTP
ncbi:hypothetical protein [Spirillospora sp. CA-294931]|uniref:hypothetical protein n=1 Tax=Spirillospora sp. CA-294931 TaxID=3240042 RepID=UPI003D8A7B58